ncbi:MAG: NAD(P)-dependent dehydrogenase (short-subunit alcohol dehydrogenase family) [Acidimicrobiales bacterium]|jgi:NAD(P)-dependent dehydrogenase (short-subunit alcohol dehydrogenase family)
MSTNHPDLTGKVAVVTGGSRGMGREMIKAFAAAGADVVIASRKFDACAILAKEVEKETGRKALPVECHVGYWEQCNDLADKVYEEFGRCDILVNNAGMSPLYDSVADISESLYDKVFDVNLKGPFRLMALFGDRMAKADGGSIINVSSVAAVRPTPNEATYGAAKAGLNALTLSLAREYGPKVRVNCIMPGPFLTDISKAWDLDEFNRVAQDTIALQRGGEPHEVVGAALYFASDLSSYTTGAILKIDGGAVYPAS